jgi:hypothetical protein
LNVDDALERLRALARGWGGDLQQIDLDSPLWSLLIRNAPFSKSLGVDHARKIVYFTDGFEIGEVIHEMGHVFASNRPDFSEEYDFFGWEFLVAVEVDLVEEWVEAAGNYSVGGPQYVEFGDMTREEQSDLLEERVQCAERIGLVRDGKPVSVR